MRRRPHNGFIFAVLIAAAFSLTAAAQAPKRIKFAPGATSAVVSGHLNGYRLGRRYVIRVRAGQTLTTRHLGGGTHPITIFVTDPGGQDVGDSDASCNNRREIVPTVAGDYRIRVVECRKADRWHGPFRFRVTVQ
jgi:hypothetical protein